MCDSKIVKDTNVRNQASRDRTNQMRSLQGHTEAFIPCWKLTQGTDCNQFLQQHESVGKAIDSDKQWLNHIVGNDDKHQSGQVTCLAKKEY